MFFPKVQSLTTILDFLLCVSNAIPKSGHAP